MNPERIVQAAQLACLLEVSTDKPGNVTWGKAFWDAHYVDFMASAVAIGPALRGAAENSVGQTILHAVRDTQRFVRSNTNLGMVLLLVPLAQAARGSHHQGLRTNVRAVLRALSVDDARCAFEAIRLAAPGGLGDSDVYDVRIGEVDVTLLEAMRAGPSPDALEGFDRSIREDEHYLNPGTTADLTTASIFVLPTEGGGLEGFDNLLARW